MSSGQVMDILWAIFSKKSSFVVSARQAEMQTIQAEM